ncbi:arginine--tRNA ligase [Gaertneriomyces semiglobifer]|nr:arginine--tRNA ligase [Gaertneriomyces semiglobifer]
MSLPKQIQARLLTALKAVVPAAIEFPNVTAVEWAAGGPKGHGDLQIKGVFAAAKRLKQDPKELAQKVIEQLDLKGLASGAAVDGPGFINVTVDDQWLGKRIGEIYWSGEEPTLGAEKLTQERVVIDYSSPNLAKEMHVGHLRSTIIGDAIARVYMFLGAEVVRQNHVGDWGTQFGMLIAHVLDTNDVNLDELQDLEQLYVQAKIRFDSEPEFKERAREYVVKLQGGEEEILQLWKKILDVSIRHSQTIYDTLGVLLQPSDVRGESSYNNDLHNVVADLDKAGLIVVDDGAKVVYTPAFQKDFGKGKPIFMVQKGGDGFGYAATDLAAIRYRVNALKGTKLLYVVDNRQALHFKQLFDVSRRGGFLPDNVVIQHVGFGTMMGKDKKPFKTRTGGTVKLAELIDSAIERAYQLAADKNNQRAEADRFSDEQLRDIAKGVGIGAVKYADLSKNRERDYVFDIDAMLRFEGDTAPYLMYAYTRSRSVARGAVSLSVQMSAVSLDSGLTITHPAEHTLALVLLQFPDELQNVVNTSCPHHLCGYLYKLATTYTKFYDACPVLKSEGNMRETRLRLCEATATTLKTGLGLLGIKTVEVM